MPKVFSPTINPTLLLDVRIYVAELQSCFWPVTQMIDPGPPLHSFRASSGLQHIGGPVRKLSFSVFDFNANSLIIMLQGYEHM